MRRRGKVADFSVISAVETLTWSSSSCGESGLTAAAEKYGKFNEILVAEEGQRNGLAYVWPQMQTDLAFLIPAVFDRSTVQRCRKSIVLGHRMELVACERLKRKKSSINK